MQKLNVIIADDEENALEILSGLLLDTNKINILKQITDPHKIESSIACLKPDAVFLDIQMPDYNGVDLLKNLRTYRPALPVIYVSAHQKFAFEAAKLNPFNYLLKPVNREELLLTIDRLIEFREKFNINDEKIVMQIKLPVKNGMVFLEPNEIILLTAEGNYTNLKLINGKLYTSSYNLGKLFEKLPLYQFERISRRVVVNKHYLKEVNRREKYCTVVVGNITEKISVSSTFLHSIGK